MSRGDIADAVASEGFAIVPDVLSLTAVTDLRSLLARATVARSSRRDNDDLYAMRNLFDVIPEARDVAVDSALRALIAPILGRRTFVVRSILFDKTAQRNWSVPWHQDRSIAVQERIDVAGFGPWSVKGGIIHVEPPVEILLRMLTVRLHLDACHERNGPLHVVPGSHREGRLAFEQIRRQRDSWTSVSCPVGVGGALLMRPLLLHASSAALSPGHRRVLHLEFASGPLPGGLRWACESAARDDHHLMDEGS